MEEERAYNEHGFHHLPPSGAVAATGGHVPVVPGCSPGVGVVPNAPILHRTRCVSQSLSLPMFVKAMAIREF